MLISVSPEPADILGRLEWALARLDPGTDQDAVLGVVLAVRSLVASAHHDDRLQGVNGPIRHIADALKDAGVRICAAVAPLEEDYVLAGIQSAVRVLEIFSLPEDHRFGATEFNRMLDDIDHAILLADELDALIRRRSIASRAVQSLGPSLSSGGSGSAGASVH